MEILLNEYFKLWTLFSVYSVLQCLVHRVYFWWCYCLLWRMSILFILYNVKASLLSNVYTVQFVKSLVTIILSSIFTVYVSSIITVYVSSIFTVNVSRIITVYVSSFLTVYLSSIITVYVSSIITVYVSVSLLSMCPESLFSNVYNHYCLCV